MGSGKFEVGSGKFEVGSGKLEVRSGAQWLLVWWLLLGLGTFSYAERVEDVPNPRVRDASWVTDLPRALTPETVGRLNSLIDALEQENGAEMAVVVVQNLDGKSIESFATELFNLWGIGKRESNNGVLLLWALDERRVRIEVGTGLGAVIPDDRAGAVLDGAVIPLFKQRQFDAGVLAGIEELAALLRGEASQRSAEAVRSYTPLENPSPLADDFVQSGRQGSDVSLVWVALGGLASLLGGVFGFRRWRRFRKRVCPSCGTQMVRLPESSDDAHLDPARRLEEKLGSVDYDVWECPSCRHNFSLRYPKWFTSYGGCPQCSHRTRSKTRTTIRSATTTSTGRAKVVEDCEFCTYHQEYFVTIPRKSSSSSSSSSSSFGGGSSSGGGASRGY